MRMSGQRQVAYKCLNATFGSTRDARCAGKWRAQDKVGEQAEAVMRAPRGPLYGLSSARRTCRCCTTRSSSARPRWSVSSWLMTPTRAKGFTPTARPPAPTLSRPSAATPISSASWKKRSSNRETPEAGCPARRRPTICSARKAMSKRRVRALGPPSVPFIESSRRRWPASARRSPSSPAPRPFTRLGVPRRPRPLHAGRPGPRARSCARQETGLPSSASAR